MVAPHGPSWPHVQLSTLFGQSAWRCLQALTALLHLLGTQARILAVCIRLSPLCRKVLGCDALRSLLVLTHCPAPRRQQATPLTWRTFRFRWAGGSGAQTFVDNPQPRLCPCLHIVGVQASTYLFVASINPQAMFLWPCHPEPNLWCPHWAAPPSWQPSCPPFLSPCFALCLYRPCWR